MRAATPVMRHMCAHVDGGGGRSEAAKGAPARPPPTGACAIRHQIVPACTCHSVEGRSHSALRAARRGPSPPASPRSVLRGHVHGEALGRAGRGLPAAGCGPPLVGAAAGGSAAAAAARITTAHASAAASAVEAADDALPLPLRLLGRRLQPPPALRQPPAAALSLAATGPSWPDPLRRPPLSSLTRAWAEAAAAAARPAACGAPPSATLLEQWHTAPDAQSESVLLGLAAVPAAKRDLGALSGEPGHDAFVVQGALQRCDAGRPVEPAWAAPPPPPHKDPTPR
eukprot:353344-Chlamydomonas_euryale.AAC.1